MAQNLLKYFSIPLLFLVAVGLTTYNELRFHLAGVRQLTPEITSSFENMSFDQVYEIDKDMLFKVEIENKEKKSSGTLLWPGEPFADIFVLVPRQGDDLNELTKFRGRLIRCVYQCTPDNMLIEMEDFTALLAKKFNIVQDKAHHLPQAILDTSQVPEGLLGYIKRYKARLMILAGFWLMGFAGFLNNSRKGLPGLRSRLAEKKSL